MFSTQNIGVLEANGYQYWPTWMLYNLQTMQGFNQTHIPFTFTTIDSSQIKEESTVSEKQTPPCSPKLGFV